MRAIIRVDLKHIFARGATQHEQRGSQIVRGSYPFPLMSKGERKEKIKNMEKGGAWSQGEHDWLPSMTKGEIVE